MNREIIAKILTALFLAIIISSGCVQTSDKQRQKDSNINKVVESDQEFQYGVLNDSRDGNSYKTIKIGNQIWMAENLRYLPNVSAPLTGSEKESYYYVYDYHGIDVLEAKATDNYKKFGVLYNWAAATSELENFGQTADFVQGVCPDGWFLPGENDWKELIEYLGGANKAGGKLKEKDTLHWKSPNTGAINSSGFAALPVGVRSYEGFIDYGEYSFFWSSDEDYYYNASSLQLDNLRSKAVMTIINKQLGLSVRCIMK